MKSIIVGMIATTFVVLLSGLFGLFMPLVGGISALIPHLSGATLTVVSSIVNPNSALTSAMGSCCICIPIPLAFGFFALFQRAHASALKERLSEHDADI